MRFLAPMMLALALVAAPSISAAESVVIRDPAQYAQTFADSMALAGVRPIREAFEAMLAPNALPAEADASLRTYEQAITHLPARISRVIEDLELGGAFRTIYLYHYYGENSWIFTRLDFVRVGSEEWTLNRIAFADRWANVVLTTTPGFQPAPRR